MTIEVALLEPSRHAEFTGPLRTGFGLPFDAERAERVSRLADVFHRIAALDGDTIVGSAGAYRLTMTTPGGSVATLGLSMVGVLPTHRRRGILTRLVRRHLDEARAAAIPVSALWASEAPIYGRFGYGIGSFCGTIALERDRVRFRRPAPAEGRLRFVEEPEARATFAAIWERVRPETPGMLSRSERWWQIRHTTDYDLTASPLQRVVLEIDGRPEGYALYRLEKVKVPGPIETTVTVNEAVATSPRATSLLWRYLCDLDLVRTIRASGLPPTHPLLHLLTDPRRLHMTLEDALWLRLVDVTAALEARTWQGREAITFALSDSFCPWNEGVHRLDGATGKLTRSAAAPDLQLDAAALGGLYLGGTTWRQLAAAGDIQELTPGAIDRADRLFHSTREPWCPEIF